MNVRIVFLGTNGWYDTKTGNTICILIRSDKHNVILDAGNGFHHMDNYADINKETFLFLSHFHLDHLAGLHILNKMKALKKISVFGPAGTRQVLGTLLNTPFTLPLARLPLDVNLNELPADMDKIPFNVEVRPLQHTQQTLGYRITLENRVITYCPDTGYCENAVALAAGADLLIAECAYLPGEFHPDWPHLNPETAARIAVDAKAKQLALVHFDASRYLELDQRTQAALVARRIMANTIAAQDLMEIEL